MILTALDSPAVVDAEVRYRSKIAIFATVRGFLSEYIAITFDTEKLQWRSYPVVKNFEDNYVYSFQENTRT